MRDLRERALVCAVSRARAGGKAKLELPMDMSAWTPEHTMKFLKSTPVHAAMEEDGLVDWFQTFDVRGV